MQIEYDSGLIEFSITAGIRLTKFLRDNKGDLLLNEDQITAVNELGFGGLLDIHLKKVPYGIVSFLVKNFGGISRIQTISKQKNDSYYITPNDVHDILSLPLHPGNPVPVTKENAKAEDVEEFMRLWQVGPKSPLKVSKGTDLFKVYTDGGDDFKKVFVMYYVSSILFPDCDEKIKSSLFQAVNNISKVKDYDWCTYTLERLCQGVDRVMQSMYSLVSKADKLPEVRPGVKYGGKRTINACVLVLLVVYWYRVPFQGIRYNNSLPLIKHLTDQLVSEQMAKEKVTGYGTALTETTANYPITTAYRDYCASRNADPVNTEFNEETHIEEPVIEKNVNPEIRMMTVHESTRQEVAGETLDALSGSDKFIHYEIPAGFQTDDEIKKSSKNRLDTIGTMLKRDISIVLGEHSKRLADYESNRCSQAQKDVDEWGIPDEAIIGNEQWLSLVDAISKKFFTISRSVGVEHDVDVGADTFHDDTHQQ